MDINDTLNKYILKFHVSDCVPRYKKYLESIAFLNRWMKQYKQHQIIVVGRKTEIEYFKKAITITAYKTIYYESVFGINVDEKFKTADLIINISFFWKDEIYINLVNQNVNRTKICNLYELLENNNICWDGDFFNIYNSGYHSFRKGDFSYDYTDLDIGLLYFQHRRRYEIAQDKEEKGKYIEELIFDSVYIRDFLSMQRWIDVYSSLFQNKKSKWYITFSIKVSDLLLKIKQALEEREEEDFLMVWLDALEYGEDKVMPFLKKIDEASLSFSNIYTVTPYTGATFKTLFAQMRVIEEKSYSISVVDENNSPFIDALERRSYQFKYHGVKKIVQESLSAQYSYTPYSSITECYWNAIRDILLLQDGKKYFGVLHEIVGTHIPYISIGLNDKDYFFVESWPGQQDQASEKNQQTIPSRIYVDSQLEFYSKLLPKRMFKMYMSDHGHTLLGRYHALMKVQQEKVKSYCCDKVISYYNFIDIVMQLIDHYEINESKLGNGTAIIQDVCYYFSDYIKEYIKDPDYNPDHMFAYQGIVTDKDIYIHYQNDIRYYQKHINDEIMVSDERLQYLESLLSSTEFNVNEHDKFQTSRIIYEAERRCLERTKGIEQKKYEVVSGLFEETDKIAIRGGGMHTLRLLMILPYNLRERVKYIIDMDYNCLASKLGIKVIDPTKIDDYSIGYIVISSFDYEKQWSKQLYSLNNKKWVVKGIYSELEKNGIVCHKEFYKKEYIKSDFIMV